MKYSDLANASLEAFQAGIERIINKTLRSVWDENAIGWHEQWDNVDLAGIYASCEGIVLLSKYGHKDMRELHFEDGLFDALWVCSSFVHIPKDDVTPVLNEFKRILKADGILFINAVIGDLPYRLETEEEIGGTFKGNGRYFQWYPSSSSFVEILNIAGFNVEKIYTKSVTSQVVENATLRTNTWFNYICKSKCI